MLGAGLERIVGAVERIVGAARDCTRGAERIVGAGEVKEREAREELLEGRVNWRGEGSEGVSGALPTEPPRKELGRLTREAYLELADDDR